MSNFTFTNRERSWLWTVSIFGLVGPNGIALYGTIRHWSNVSAAFRNPVALGFISDAFLAMILLAYLFVRWNVGKLSWVWFVVLSLAGGLLFSIPAFLLMGATKTVTIGTNSSTSLE